MMSEYDLKPSDALHLGAMMSDGVTLVVSEDRKFERIGAIERLWTD